MRPYEVMLILESAADDDTVNSVVERITGVVTADEGSFGSVEKWGRRRFAYELKHRWEGYYAVAQVTAKPETMTELDRQLTLADEVVRHKIIRLPESVAGKKPASQPESSSQPAGVGAADTTGE